MAWLASIFSGITATFVAFILHNKITWKERNPGRYGVESTGIYVLMTIVTMTLNYIFYEKVVFGNVAKVQEKEGEEVDVERVRKAGKETQSQKKTKRSTNK